MHSVNERDTLKECGCDGGFVSEPRKGLQGRRHPVITCGRQPITKKETARSSPLDYVVSRTTTVVSPPLGQKRAGRSRDCSECRVCEDGSNMDAQRSLGGGLGNCRHP